MKLSKTTDAKTPASNTQDKLPPNDLAAEQGALGAVLLDVGESLAAMGQLVEALPFGSESFYQLKHQWIYEAMLDLFGQRKPIDVIGVQSLLKARSQIDTVELVYLAGLPDKAAASTMVDHYAAIVAGKAVLREIIQIGLTAVEKVEQCEDHTELVDWLESKVMRLSAHGARSPVQPMPERVAGAIEILDRIQSGDLEPGGLTTGIWELDRKTMGLLNGDYIILAGRPSTGKSALAMNILSHLAIDKAVPVGFISLEMTGAQLTNRIISAQARVDSFRIQRTKLEEIEVTRITGAVGKISRAPLFICDRVRRDLNSIKSAGRRLKLDHKIRLLSIDFLQLMTAGTRYRNSNEEVGFISGEIKQLAIELDIPILMISQLNRESDKGGRRAPRLSDLRSSGAIEQDADLVWLMWRPADEEDQDVTQVELLIEKQRNGPTGWVDLEFHRKFTQFLPRSLIQEDLNPLTVARPGL